jgi:hypothetical protein
MIKGKEYDFEDIKIKLFDKEPIGITGIKYGHKQEAKFQHGMGKHAISYTKGKYEATGELSLLQSELEALQRTLPKGKSLTDIPPFDITVSYAMEGDANTTTDTLKSCIITGLDKELKTGGEAMEVKLPMIITQILYNS